MIRKKVVIRLISIASVIFTLVIYTLNRNLIKGSVGFTDIRQQNWIQTIDPLVQLENDIIAERKIIEDIRKSLKARAALVEDVHFKDDGCSIRNQEVPETNIQMLQVYEEIDFVNTNGGIWKQGFEIELDENNWNSDNKLKVFVVPHSHNDPGWIRTVDEYYSKDTKNILNNMLTKLEEYPKMKFIWAEISYFSMWWNDINMDERERVKKLLKRNQLEIVTGGWVMNDEANSHWLSIVHQLTEGHQWLERHLNYTPRSHWSIDPFGLSPTQALLLKTAGLQNMLIQRVHYSVKKELARNKELEFYWTQLWDDTEETKIFTQVMPFYAYDIPHTCGPDPSVCCQFDFRRLKDSRMRCPWRKPPVEITQENVAERALLLLDQYKKKSMLFETNALLIPLGDDFRYNTKNEWDLQYNNYKQLMDYMNSNPELNVEIQFGTLSDYFDEVHNQRSADEFPILTGDFFTYSDRDDHYWSGYYTSRPFYKRMDRILLGYLRAAEVITTLLQLSQSIDSQPTGIVDLELSISEARRSLALFQHHDGITGTAKTFVVEDYAERMLRSIKGLQNVIETSTSLLLLDLHKNSIKEQAYVVDDIWKSKEAGSERHTIVFGPEQKEKHVIIYNSLPYVRHEIVSFIVSTPYLQVLNRTGPKIRCQISPIFEDDSISDSKYELTFAAEVPPLGLVEYVIQALDKKYVPRDTAYARAKIYNYDKNIVKPADVIEVEVSASLEKFSLRIARLTASFTELGLLEAIKINEEKVPVRLDFAKYGVRNTREKSGAYIFLPDGDAIPLSIKNKPIVKVIEGPFVSSVNVLLPYVNHYVKLYNSKGADGLGLEIQNLVDIRKTSNFELVMRLTTDIKNNDDFYTDLNSYQMIRRKYFEKLPLQANYYPMPSTVYIQDENIRLTVISGSSLGCASLREGHLEIMQDRRLQQDDNRGLGQGVVDNHPIRHIFKIILEEKKPNCQAVSEDHPAGFLSLAAHVSSQSLHNPLINLLGVESTKKLPGAIYAPLEDGFSSDYTLPILRTGVTVGAEDYIAVSLHRQHLDMCYADESVLLQFPLSKGKVNLGTLLLHHKRRRLIESSLTYLYKGKEIDINQDIHLCPMEIKTFLL